MRVLGEGEYLGALVAKLGEEAGEVAEAVAGGGAAEVVEEAADVLEVLRALVRGVGVEWDEVERVAAEKRRERGGFEGRYYLEA
ncbi:MazG nucleotide pyrophosphohydrolase domain-containing protein [Bailinhaonella thermotolerans]|uniref:MazG nucleotide pyrophosphohydrolase domain-containing protein n=1 Tax=Bailinhaonella thermotolerans TaxID=1070861 RepID=UPI001F5B82FD|nr:MazG nucleotide pyrophosphohydrolase domain-containing protein [Bailinhaonella thermotolerans]